MPLNAMFFNYMIPLIGSARGTWPSAPQRVLLLGVPRGGLFLHLSFLTGRRRTAVVRYANLTTRPFSPGNIDFWSSGCRSSACPSMSPHQLPRDHHQHAARPA